MVLIRNSLFPAGGVHDHDPTHITAILGESVIFNCHVEFPGDHPVPYVLQWEKKVSETVRIDSFLASPNQNRSFIPVTYYYYDNKPPNVEQSQTHLLREKERKSGKKGGR